MEADIIISVNDTVVMQNQTPILEDLNFKIRNGEFVYLIGKTGSGKSSLLRTLYADLEAGKGKIQVAGFQVDSPNQKDIPFLRRKLGIIFQDFELFTDRSVEQNLYFVMKATGWNDKTLMKNRIAEVLGNVGLDGIQKKMPHQLSGGEQQRVAIARALVNHPLIVLADEPTGNLDPTVADEILDLFIEINKTGTAVIMATHHHSFLRRFPSRVLYCDNGKIRDVQKDMVLRKFVNEN
ncbi:cell division ATP-binding protein FtsE [Chondrinema litorale]|uniref:cell division ATP-binding protein FtsE n=1 Tax=Chondrinema litorale TaxID=2994555 RepID=UPI002543F32E|nr:ATP-binding cassette domain-containing protein [Chondrinema litorale]UZR92975.1 ATP-binding cassette domain-containing protein [Chondrinema litorale]